MCEVLAAKADRLGSVPGILWRKERMTPESCPLTSPSTVTCTYLTPSTKLINDKGPPGTPDAQTLQDLQDLHLYIHTELRLEHTEAVAWGQGRFVVLVSAQH